jgi:NiFe hydrogenase small subunit HydA
MKRENLYLFQQAVHSIVRRLPSRRDFLKLCGLMGISAVVTYYAGDIRQVFAQTAAANGGKVHLIWLPMGGDSGCTISMLQASNPDLIDAVEDLQISADFWQPLMTPDYDLGWVSAGYTAEDKSQVPLMNAAFGNAPVDVLVIEGTPQIGAPPGGSAGDYCTIGERDGKPVNAYELLQKLAAKASYVISVGQCSAFGGIPAGKGNLTHAVPVTEALKAAGVTTKNPVINLAGCPAHPDWTLITLASVLQGFTPDLDDLGRPTAFFSHIIHDGCPRRGAYGRGEFAQTFDDPTGCFWKLGCKGPITNSACAVTKWNGGISFCTQGGPMCWGCMHPSFPDPPSSPFFSQVELVPAYFGLSVDTIAGVAAAGVALALGAHAVRHAMKRKREQTEVPKEKGESK